MHCQTHPPRACLGQSSVPKARISCLFVSVTAMLRLLTGSSLSCSVPDTNTLSTQSLGPTVLPCVHHRLLLALPYVHVSPSLQDMLHLFTMEETGNHLSGGKPCLQQPRREAEDRQLPTSAMASSPPALRCSLSPEQIISS